MSPGQRRALASLESAAGTEDDPVEGTVVRIDLLGGDRVAFGGRPMVLEELLLQLRYLVRERLEAGRELPPLEVRRPRAAEPAGSDAPAEDPVPLEVGVRLEDQIRALGFPELVYRFYVPGDEDR